VREAKALLAQQYDKGFPPFWPESHWGSPAYPDLIKAMQSGYSDPDNYPVRHQAAGDRPVLSHQHQGQGRPESRWRQDVSPDRSGRCAGQTVLVGDGL
jgi:hypothetical protein